MAKALVSEGARVFVTGISLKKIDKALMDPRAATESLSQIMAQDLASSGISVNLLSLGGPTDSGMIPEEVPVSM